MYHQVMNEDGHTSSIRDKILTITVKKGWREGTRITFPKEGDQGPNNVPADIVFIVRDKPHPRFKRDCNDLVFTARVLLGKALTGCSVEVPTLDGRLLNIPINDIIRLVSSSLWRFVCEVPVLYKVSKQISLIVWFVTGQKQLHWYWNFTCAFPLMLWSISEFLTVTVALCVTMSARISMHFDVEIRR